jgi:hypothetical protein
MLAPMPDDDLRFFQAVEDLEVETFITQICCEISDSQHDQLLSKLICSQSLL